MIVLADGGVIVIWVVGILVVGFVGFFAVLLTMLARMVRFVLRPFWPRRRDPRRAALPPLPVAPTCANPRCGHTNTPGARYCARCGQALGRLVLVDPHG